MDVTFNGYLALCCNGCSKRLTFESSVLEFEPDSSTEAEEDEYIRYVTQINANCASCSAKLQVKLDVWEYPEAVVNYSYHSIQGARDIQCEFNIDYYFDDETIQSDGSNWDSNDRKTTLTGYNEYKSAEPDEKESEANSEDKYKPLNELSNNEQYEDQYDDEDNK